MDRMWGDFDHHSVFLQILSNNPKPRSPFKFNADWLLNEDFVELLKASWIVYVDNPWLLLYHIVWLI